LFSWLYQLLYGSVPAEFKSAFDLQESADRLRVATQRSAFSVLSRQAAVGIVKESKVRLQRAIPMMNNGFKPYFFGRFETRGSDVYLTGKFTMLPFARIFMTFWLGMTLVFGTVAAVSNWDRGAGWRALPMFFGMTGLGIAFIWVAKWFARNDVAWLSNVIYGALGTPPTDRPIEARIPPSTLGVGSSTPMVLRVVAAFLALAGLASLFGAIFGPDEMQWSAKGIIGRYLSGVSPRLLASTHAIVLLLLALGIYRRKLAAWKFGLVYLAFAGCLSTAEMLTADRTPAPPVIRIAFSAFGMFVVLIWIRWWYAQRVHFLSEEHSGPSL
jgi:hypothetical protein